MKRIAWNKWGKQSERIMKIKLTDKQREFLSAFLNKEITEILVGWWARWWKSWGVCEIIIMTMIEYPWIVWLMGRNEWDDLRKSTLNTLIKVMARKGFEEWKEYTINMQTKELKLYNGSKIYFVPLKQQPSDPEFNWLWGYEITYYFIDEAQEVSDKVLSIIKSRCTEKIKEYNLVPKGFLSCNPLKCWLYDRYIKPWQEWTLKRELTFIPSLHADNPFIEWYEKTLEDADWVTRERLLFGNWEYDSTPWKLFIYNDLLNMFNNPKHNGEKYISIDWATEWKDRAVIFVWDGWEIIDWTIYEGKTNTEIIKEEALKFAKQYNIKLTNIVNDHVWVGAGISYWLGKIYQFNSNSKEIKKSDKEAKIYNSLRDQCYYNLKNYINKIHINNKFIRFKEQIVKELDIMTQIEIDKGWPIKIMKKETIKKLIKNSPDFADAISMRMVFQLEEDLKGKSKPLIYFPWRN